MPRETSETTVSSTVRTSTPRADSMSPRDGHVPRRGLGVGRAVLVGLVAGLILSTCWGFFVHSQMILPDMIVLAFSTAAGLALWRAVSDPPSPRAFVVFYAAVAFAMFAKGPVGLLPLAAAAAWLWTE